MDSLKAPSAWCRPKNKTAANVMNKEQIGTYKSNLFELKIFLRKKDNTGKGNDKWVINLLIFESIVIIPPPLLCCKIKRKKTFFSDR